MKKLLKRNHGFTIIELIVVLGILAGVVVMLTRGIGSGAAGAKINQARVDMNGRIRTAVLSYVAARGKDQAGSISASALVEPGYLKDAKDPWGDDYVFKCNKDKTIVTISPADKGKAQAAGVPAVDVDLTILE